MSNGGRKSRSGYLLSVLHKPRCLCCRDVGERRSSCKTRKERITDYDDGLGFCVNCELNLGLKMNFRDS